MLNINNKKAFTLIEIMLAIGIIGLITEWLDAEGNVEQRDEESDLGGTMRLGSQLCHLTEGSKVHQVYGSAEIVERHRHRYEFNYNFHSRFEESGFLCSGTSPDKRLVEFIEMENHPYWVGTQAHPEFKSRLGSPAPLFEGLVKAICEVKNLHKESLTV